MCNVGVRGGVAPSRKTSPFPVRRDKGMGSFRRRMLELRHTLSERTALDSPLPYGSTGHASRRMTKGFSCVDAVGGQRRNIIKDVCISFGSGTDVPPCHEEHGLFPWLEGKLRDPLRMSTNW